MGETLIVAAEDERDTDTILRSHGNSSDVGEVSAVEQKHRADADEAALLGEHQEDEVRVACRQEAQLALSAPALVVTGEPSLSDGDLGVPHLGTGTERVDVGSTKGVHALPLARFHPQAPDERSRNQRRPQGLRG